MATPERPPDELARSAWHPQPAPASLSDAPGRRARRATPAARLTGPRRPTAMPTIHPTALVDSHAELADDVMVGAFALVGPQVTIGAGSSIGPHAVLTGRTHLGARNRIFQ